MGRKTQGVRLINLVDDDVIADVGIVKNEDQETQPSSNGAEARSEEE
jgi:hypothetical protein